MHPREGWQPDGTRATRDRGPGLLSRREALRRGAAAALLAGGGGALLSSCASYLTGSADVPLPRPYHPVKWPTFGKKPIASGLPPETGATLQIYNWTAYVNQACLNNFAKKYKCKVAVTTFNTMDEALAKLRAGLKFDVFMGVTVDVLGQLIESQLIQPLNHSYIPNIAQAWPDFSSLPNSPFYDVGWQYTVPYTIYTTGISWRKDYVPEDPNTMRNPWRQMFFQPKYKGKIAVLDDYREGISLGLMMNDLYNLNTTRKDQIVLSRQTLLDLSNEVDIHIDNNDYTEIPDGQVWIHHAWSGDMAAAAQYMTKGTPVDVVGYWFPRDGKGPVANDTLTILSSATNPVLGHLFLNYMEDLPNALENISYNGYMQPINGVTPQRLVKEKILPRSLMSTAVLPADFRRGVGELQLPVDTDALWQQAWLEVSTGM
jgi:spermidine/putrescine transport system substrate-binding protein